MVRRYMAARTSFAVSLAILGIAGVAEAAPPVPQPTQSWSFDEAGGPIAHDAITGAEGLLGANARFVQGNSPALGEAHDRILALWPQQGPDDRTAFVDFGRGAGAFGTDDFTVSHYFVTPHRTAGTLCDVVGNRTSYGHGNFFAVRMRSDGILTVELDQDGAGTNYVGIVGEGKPVNDSRLHLLTYVREGATLSLYVDGALVKSGQTASGQRTNISGADSFRIGRRAPFVFTSMFALYDDLRIYDRALSAQEVQALANGG